MPRSQVIVELSRSREASGSSATDESASSPVDVALRSPPSPHQAYGTSPTDEWENDNVDVVNPSDSASIGPPNGRHRSQVEVIPPPGREESSRRPSASELVTRRSSSREHRDPSRHRDHREHRERRRHRDPREREQRQRRTSSAHSDSVGSYEDYAGYAHRPHQGRPHPHPQWAYVPHQHPAGGYASTVGSYNAYPPGQQLVPVHHQDPYNVYARPNPLSPPMYAPANPLSPSASMVSQSTGYFGHAHPQMPQYSVPMMPYQTQPSFYPYPMVPGAPPPMMPAGMTRDLAAEDKLNQLHDLIEKKEEERLAREKEREAKAAKEAAEKKAIEALADAAKQATATAEADAAKKAKEATEAHEKAVAELKATADAAKKAEEKAKKEAADAAKGPENEFIKFKDALGRKFSFPYRLCKTWKEMEGLIRQAFKNVEEHEQSVIDGNYDLIGPDGEIILPQVWESTIMPGSEITQHLWPVEEEKKPPAPPSGPHGAGKKKGKANKTSKFFAGPPAPIVPSASSLPAHGQPPLTSATSGGSGAHVAAATIPPGISVVTDRTKKKAQGLPPLIGWFGGGQMRQKPVKGAKN